MARKRARTPDWNRLFDFALGQAGLFTTKQAAEAGYSPQLLVHYVRIGKVVRIRRGVYRLVHYPLAQDEALVTVWLWSEQQGVFSHETALSLHQLSDVLPNRIHLTLPADWKHRRFRVPPGVVLHHADVTRAERSRPAAIPVTSPLRTLQDCARAQLSPELLHQAISQALDRGLIRKSDVARIQDATSPTGRRKR
ncbi:type IV toxin-antitoxin system AbiEi family antitoxin domain-containing protein [Myxococcus qinghaiensis]|uniref:type IV toxin-antitoxin system AbiEi family antitoxin domain-containing protein n=1 Tax=Myxococcus qinghaiensis TaxID=2906758 RepID=UPI0020A81298|nr:type IV toxin-antitoxin system AbiEi family antitoxin domain-containing protein [Myxococcus qinghaiensis]MCP3165832.1 type IV toxin-antitoxin system AbiEi family antitoxin domain-containing protein [Myxococcus qinghaiensis]